MNDATEQADRPPIDPAKRAAFFCRVLGAVEVVTFGACVGLLTMIAGLDDTKLQQRVREGTYSPERAAQIEQVRSTARQRAVGALLLGVIPGAGYLGLSFAVRRKRRAASLGAIVLACVQVVAVALLMIDLLTTASLRGNPSSITLIVLTLGTLLGLLIGVILWCWRSVTGDVRAKRQNHVG